VDDADPIKRAREQVTRNRLVRAQDNARGTIHRGVLLIAMIPILGVAALLAAFVIGPFGAVMAFIIAVAYGLVGGIGGLAAIAAGLTDHRKATRELRAFDAPRQLPVARVVHR
jgi:hypothetical protein